MPAQTTGQGSAIAVDLYPTIVGAGPTSIRQVSRDNASLNWTIIEPSLDSGTQFLASNTHIFPECSVGSYCSDAGDLGRAPRIRGNNIGTYTIRRRLLRRK